MRYCTAHEPADPGARYPGAACRLRRTPDPRIPRRRPGRRCGHPAVAAVARRAPQVPARPHGIGPHAAAGAPSTGCCPLTGAGRRARRDGHPARRRGRRASCPSSAPDDVLAEPSPRDSMAAIGLAAAVLLERHGEDVVLGSFAADHVIDGDRARSSRRCARASWRPGPGYVVTIGIAATGPSTAFGYVRSRRAARARRTPRPSRTCRRLHREAGRRDRDRVPGDRRVPLERRHVHRAGARAAGPPGRPSCPALHGGSAGDRGRVGRPGPRRGPRPGLAGPDEDRDRPRDRRAGRGRRRRRRRAGRLRRGTTSATSTRSRAPARRDTLGDDGVSCCGSTPTARSSCPAPGGPCPWSGCPTRSSSTPPTRVLVTTRAHAQSVKAVVDGWRARGPRGPALTRTPSDPPRPARLGSKSCPSFIPNPSSPR